MNYARREPTPTSILSDIVNRTVLYPGSAVLCAVLAIVLASAGCLSEIFPEQASVQAPTLTPTLIPVPTTESPATTVPVSQMALQISDLPSDYILKDRSDLTYLEMDQMSHDLGWSRV